MTSAEFQEQVRLALVMLERVKAEVEQAIVVIAGRASMTREEIAALKDETPAKSEDKVVADQLQKTVADIGKSVRDLTNRQADQIDKVSKTSERTGFGLKLTMAGLALDLILTIMAFFLFDATSDTSKELQEVQERTSGEVLCPLYDLFLTAYNPKGATATRDPQGYERSIVTIEKGAKALGCEHTTRGKKK